MEERLGWDYPDTVNFTVRFATALAHQNKKQQAIDIIERAEERARKNLGPDHSLTQKYAGLLRTLKGQ
jgi:hypothetical protein